MFLAVVELVGACRNDAQISFKSEVSELSEPRQSINISNNERVAERPFVERERTCESKSVLLAFHAVKTL